MRSKDTDEIISHLQPKLRSLGETESKKKQQSTMEIDQIEVRISELVQQDDSRDELLRLLQTVVEYYGEQPKGKDYLVQLKKLMEMINEDASPDKIIS